MDETKVKKSKKVIEKVPSYIVTINDLSDVTQTEILKECGVRAIKKGRKILLF